MNYFRGATRDFYIDLAQCLLLFVSLYSGIKSDSLLRLFRLLAPAWLFLLLYVVAVGSGNGSALYWFLSAPVLLFFFFERIESLIWVGLLFIAAVILVCLPDLFSTYSYPVLHRVGCLGTFLLISFSGYAIESSRNMYGRFLFKEKDALAMEKENLEKALEEIKTLSGMLPICSHCKKIRNDEGYWQQVESYLHEHSGAEFTHGICPECAARFYGDEYVPEEKKGERQKPSNCLKP